MNVTDTSETGVGPHRRRGRCAANAVAENAANGTVVGRERVRQRSGRDATRSAIRSTTVRAAVSRSTRRRGVVTVADGTLLDREAAASHSITVRATSSDGSFSTRPFSIALNDVDEFDVGAIGDANAAVNQVAENASTGTIVGLTAAAADADATTNGMTYTLDDSAGGRFAIDAGDGRGDGGRRDAARSRGRRVPCDHRARDLGRREQLRRRRSRSRSSTWTSSTSAPSPTATSPQIRSRERGERLGRRHHRARRRTPTRRTTRSPIRWTTMRAVASRSTPRRASSPSPTARCSIARARFPIRSRCARPPPTAASPRSASRCRSATSTNSTSAPSRMPMAPSTRSPKTARTARSSASRRPRPTPMPPATRSAYSLDDSAGGRFAIDAATGVVTVADGSLLDREAAASHSITVRATSADASFSTQTFSIALNDVDEFDVGALADANAAVNQVAENAANGHRRGHHCTRPPADADATTSAIVYSLDDSAGGRFAIDPVTGVVTVDDGALLDREAAASCHDLRARGLRGRQRRGRGVHDRADRRGRVRRRRDHRCGRGGQPGSENAANGHDRWLHRCPRRTPTRRRTRSPIRWTTAPAGASRSMRRPAS